MKNGLFHKEIGFPNGAVQQVIGVRKLNYTRHSLTAMVEDRYVKAGEIPRLPKAVNVFPDSIVELQVEEGRVNKVVMRQSYDRERDLVLVLALDGPAQANVKTVWMNESRDLHSTLRRELYSRP